MPDGASLQGSQGFDVGKIEDLRTRNVEALLAVMASEGTGHPEASWTGPIRRQTAHSTGGLPGQTPSFTWLIVNVSSCTVIPRLWLSLDRTLKVAGNSRSEEKTASFSFPLNFCPTNVNCCCIFDADLQCLASVLQTRGIVRKPSAEPSNHAGIIFRCASSTRLRPAATFGISQRVVEVIRWLRR